MRAAALPCSRSTAAFSAVAFPVATLLRAGLVLACVCALAAPAATAQANRPSDPPSLQGRHRLAVQVGLLPDIEASPGGTRLSAINGGASYTYWPGPAWGLEAGTEVHTSEAVPGAAATLLSVTAGPTLAPASLALGQRVRPYLSAAVGAYLGVEATGRFWPQTRTEAVPGLRLGGGVGAFLGRWVYLGMDAAYHLAPDFPTPVADVRSARGMALTLQAGLMLGGR
jgi:hypothetical protein